MAVGHQHEVQVHQHREQQHLRRQVAGEAHQALVAHQASAVVLVVLLPQPLAEDVLEAS